jgi:transposase
VTTASRFRFFNDAQWELISALLPSNDGRRGHPFGDDRRVVEGIIYGIGQGFRGVTCRVRSSGRGKRCGNAIVAMPVTARGIGC